MSELLIFFSFFLLLVVLYNVRQTKSQVGELEHEIRNELRSLRRELSPQTKPESKVDPPVSEIPEATPPKQIELPESPAPPPLPVDVTSTPVPVAQEKEPVIAATPREPSKFESAAKEGLRKIWSWIVVGEEHRDKGVTMEFAIATTWGIRIGILFVVIGTGFILQRSIENGLIGPKGKVSLCILAATGLIIWGLRMFDGKYKALGQGFCGAGFATLYLSFYTAFHENVLNMGLSFALMALVTLAAGFLAIKLNSQLIAILGLLGGYGTPLMIASGSENLVGLFTYILLLGVGVLYISWKKEWRLLHYLSFAATFFLFFGASKSYFETEKFWLFMPFLVGIFILFSTITFIFHLVNRKKSTLLELLFLFLNAGMFFGFSVYFVKETYSQETLSWVTLSLAAFYVGHVYYFLKRNIQDKGLLLAFIGMAAFFVAITLPLILSEGWITVSWAIQGFVMLWIASRMRSEFLRQLTYLLYWIVLFRFLFFDLGSEFGSYAQPESVGVYLKELIKRLCVFGLPVASFFAAGKLFGTSSNSSLVVDDANDVQPWIGSSRAAKAFFWLMVAMTFLYLNFEVVRSFRYLFRPFQAPAMTILWAGLCLAFLLGRLRGAGKAITVFLWIFVAATIIKVFFVDAWGWRPSNSGAFRQVDFFHGFGMRLIDYGVLIGVLFFGWNMIGKTSPHRTTGKVFGYLGLGLLFIYSSQEVWTFLYHYLHGFRMGGISIYWAMFAVAMIFAGILKGISALRGIALLLLIGVVLKVFFIDLSELDQFYRIIAFLGLGVLVLGCSFVYLKYRSSFETETKD